MTTPAACRLLVSAPDLIFEIICLSQCVSVLVRRVNEATLTLERGLKLLMRRRANEATLTLERGLKLLMR